MNPDNRDWGGGSPFDYIPVLGVVYRCYWCSVAKRGERRDSDSRWVEAFRSELGRLFVALTVTAAAAVFVAFGGTEGGTEPAVLVVVSGLFFHRLLSLAVIAGA